MLCPICGSHSSRVLDSRDTDAGSGIRRRRECLACHGRFTTYERAEAETLFVVKKDGRREQFNSAKLLAGLVKACEKCPISYRSLERISINVERELRASENTEVRSAVVGECVCRALRDLDEVAYLRYVSVFREFRQAEPFAVELQIILDRKRSTKYS